MISDARSRGFFWLSLYFAANIALTLHNKSILSRTNFAFPWTLTAMHSVASVLGSAACVYLCGIGRVADVRGWQHWAWLVAFSLLYTINIGMSTVSMNLVLLSFHQTVRSLNPLFTCALEYFVMHKSTSAFSLLTLVPVIVGVALACYGEFGFTALGAVLTLFGVFLSSAKGVATNLLLVGPLRLDPFDLLLRMSFLCTLQCLAYAWFSGELGDVVAFFDASDDAALLAFQLASNAALAFALSYLSFVANKATSSLSMSVVGNIKQVLLIALTVWLFGDVLGATQWIGVFMTLVGGALYTYSKS
jgi:drug/metabolite transporter (DMT)-like permease